MASVHSNNSVHVWGSEQRPSVAHVSRPPWIIKMPRAMRSSCKLFLVLHLAPTSHFGRARLDHLGKVQIRCFLPHSPLLPLIFLNLHALLKQSQTRSCKRGNKLVKFIYSCSPPGSMTVNTPGRRLSTTGPLELNRLSTLTDKLSVAVTNSCYIRTNSPVCSRLHACAYTQSQNGTTDAHACLPGG